MKGLLNRYKRAALHEHEKTWKEEQRRYDENLPWIVLRATLLACRLHHLTTIRRKVVSPLSAFARGGLCAKRNHAFVFNAGSNETKSIALDQVRDFGRRPAFAKLRRGRHACRYRRESSFPVADHFAAHRPLINAGEVFLHRRCQQRNVRDFAEMFGDEPGRFVSSHPVQMIEPREVHPT